MNINNPHITPYGDHSILVQWVPVMDQKINQKIHALSKIIRTWKDVEDTIAGYCELLIVFRDQLNRLDLLSDSITQILEDLDSESNLENNVKLIEVPVCYNSRFGYDLDNMCYVKGISKEELVDFHTQPTYHVFMIGFLPGFPYLGGLNKILYQARLDHPRPEVSQGSVGIAGNQTGIYTCKSPGGWNIIGRSPIRFFFPECDPPCLIEPGDKVRFKAIEEEQFFEMKEKSDHQTFDFQTLISEWKS